MAWFCIRRIESGRILLESEHLESSGHLGPSRLRGSGLVAGNHQDVTGAALGEIRLRLVDPGLHDDRALPPIHAALDGAGDLDLQLPPLAAERKERRVTGRSKVTQAIIVYRGDVPPGEGQRV